VRHIGRLAAALDANARASTHAVLTTGSTARPRGEKAEQLQAPLRVRAQYVPSLALLS
jgi:hypothetical protein